MESRAFNMGGPGRTSRMDMAIAVAQECGFAHEGYFVPAEKAKQVPAGDNPLVSPLDISMISNDLEMLIGKKFRGLEDTVKAIFR